MKRLAIRNAIVLGCLAIGFTTSIAMAETNWFFVEKFEETSGKNISSISKHGSNDTTLIIACRAKEPTVAFLAFPLEAERNLLPVPPLGEKIQPSPFEVRFRFGDDEVFKEQWLSNVGLVYTIPKTSRFFKELPKGEAFVIEATDAKGVRARTFFDNSTDENLEFVMGGCKSDQ